MSKPYKVGVIGYGLSAKIFHIPFILDLPNTVVLAAIVQRTPKPNDDASADHPKTTIYRTADELIADPSIDVVVLTTAPDSHFSLVSQALRADKHVLVEKPFTPTSTEAHDLVKIANDAGKLLTVYQNRRYDRDFLTLKQVLDEGKLGRVVEFESHFDRHRPEMPTATTWKTDPASYSAVYDLGTHLMDQVVSLYGLPRRITGFVGTQRRNNTIGLEDSFTAVLVYDDALSVTVKAGVVSAEVEQLRFWVRGEKGSFKKFHLDPQEDQLKGGLRPGRSGYGEEDERRWAVVTSVDGSGKVEAEKVKPVESKGYTRFYEQFAKALEAGDARLLPVDAAVAANVIKLCELMRQSSSERRTLDV